MKSLSIVVPIVVIAIVTLLAALSAVWLTGLVPAGPWSELIKAAIVLFIIGSILVIIVWSAYFSYIVRETIERLLKKD
jgi:membrane protein implicated in regulation of membrane protease activity